MSLSTSLANALSGLNVQARAASVVSANIANATTEGYGRRELDIVTRQIGGGVRVEGVTRNVDEAVIGERRGADAGFGLADTRVSYLSSTLDIIGSPEDAGSLSGRLRQFESALIEASGRPDEPVRLANVLATAQSLSGEVNAISDGIQTLRQDADREIALQVGALNAGLEAVRDLNAAIAGFNGAGRDASALIDQRQVAIDQIASIVPLRELPRDDGKVALITEGGAILLDVTAREIGFQQTPIITPDMTLASGALSPITIDGDPAAFDGPAASLAGGSLEALIRLRDETLPTQQARADAFARDLVDRFADPALDATTAAGAAGLFTDRGAAFAPADLVGLAGRLEVNPAADPDQGGALWRLRDGLGATVEGPVGNGQLLGAYYDALTTVAPPADTTITTAARSTAGLASDLSSLIGGELLIAERDAEFRTALRDSLLQQERSGGVNTDDELQKLLLIEQSYAANARVIQTLDELFQQIIGL
ncbi:MAG: flagellar hook-associated protein FlgK [Pseudomonadota bacterium]